MFKCFTAFFALVRSHLIWPNLIWLVLAKIMAMIVIVIMIVVMVVIVVVGLSHLVFIRLFNYSQINWSFFNMIIELLLLLLLLLSCMMIIMMVMMIVMVKEVVIVMAR